jgi:hypothetical protein
LIILEPDRKDKVEKRFNPGKVELMESSHSQGTGEVEDQV